MFGGKRKLKQFGDKKTEAETAKPAKETPS
jgi:hypothetical protein